MTASKFFFTKLSSFLQLVKSCVVPFKHVGLSSCTICIIALRKRNFWDHHYWNSSIPQFSLYAMTWLDLHLWLFAFPSALYRWLCRWDLGFHNFRFSNTSHPYTLLWALPLLFQPFSRSHLNPLDSNKHLAIGDFNRCHIWCEAWCRSHDPRPFRQVAFQIIPWAVWIR